MPGGNPVVINFSFNGRQYPTLESGLQYTARTLDFTSNRVQAAAIDELKKFLNEIASVMEALHSQTYPGNRMSLSRRSGTGVDSIRKSITVTGTTLATAQGKIGGESYLGVHEFGANIRVKAKQYMAVPLTAALNNDGTLQRPRPRDWDRTFVNRSRKGNLIIFRRTGGKIVPLYLLVGPGEQVDHIEFAAGASGRGRGPLRLKMGEAINARIDNFTAKLADRLVKEMQNGASVPA